MNHVILDFETLSTRPSACILSMGLVPFSDDDSAEDKTFEELKKDGIHVKFDVKRQVDLGRTINHDTLDWWSKQSPEAKKVFSPRDSDMAIEYLPKIINGFIKQNGITSYSNWYARGMMDYPIFESIYRDSLEVELPEEYKFWNCRDLRTAIHFLTGNERGKIELSSEIMSKAVVHNALDDCCLDVLRLQEGFKALGEN